MAELPAVPVIWQYYLVYVEQCSSDLADLPVPVIWQKAELPVCGQECAFDLAELTVCGQCASDLAELPVCRQCASDWAELPVSGGWRRVPVIRQNCLCQ